MEPWQECHIIKNLSDFVKFTTTNTQLKTYLQADGVLGNADLEKLAAVEVLEGCQAASKVLFDRLLTRKNSYKAIGKAAFKTNQTGTFYLLLKGLIKQLLHKSNIDLDDEVMDDVINTECLIEDDWIFFNTKIDNPTLYEDSRLPQQRALYFPRHISNRIKLNPSVFNQKCRDIFVLSGLDRPALTKLAKSNPTATSKEVLFKKYTNVRFVWLDHSQDWNKLRTLWSEPVHLIHFDKYSSEYILQDSTAQSQLLTSHVPLHLRKISLYVSEHEFLNSLETKLKNNGDTICICDTPGMGKSWLLEHIALLAQHLYPNVVVALISLQQFVQHTQMSMEGLSSNLSGATQILFRYLFSFRLTSKIVEIALQKNMVKLQLFLDGFDEIPTEYLDAAKQLFQSIADNHRNISLIITSRPHMRIELAKTFKAVAYDILPFSEQTQLEYLVKFWQNFAEQEGRDGVQIKKLKTYAKACLKKLRTELTKDEEDIMGIPLQCFMVATINVEYALMYAIQETRANVMEFMPASSMYDMFKSYTEIGFVKATKYNDKFNYEVEVRKRNQDNNKNMSGSQQRQKLKAFHVWKALQILIPELADDYFKWENLSERKPSKLILACGILQNTGFEEDSGSVRFVHRNFAEYLVAEHFADILTGCYSLTCDLVEKYLRWFFQFILSAENLETTQFLASGFFVAANVKLDFFQFSNSTVAYFLNECLERKTCSRVTNITLKQLQFFLPSNDLASKILRACISSSHSNILRLLRHILNKATTDLSSGKRLRKLFNFPAELVGNISGFFPDENYLSSCAYLCQAARVSSVVVLEELYHLFKECFHENLDDVCSRMPTELVTPLHYAVKRLDYSLVEFFVERITVPKRCLLYLCIYYILEASMYEYENTVGICKLLVTTDNSVVLDVHESKHDCNYRKIGSVILNARYVETIKFLVEHGANIRATYCVNGYFETVLTKNSYVLSKGEFKELCQYLINDVKAYDLFRTNLPLWDDPLPKIIRIVDEVILNQILTLPEVQIGRVDKKGNNLVLIAIRYNDNINVFKQLVDLGVDLYSQNHKGENALHLAVASGKIKAVKYLLSKGFSLDEKDKFGNTPLHHSCKTINVKYTILKANTYFKFLRNVFRYNQYHSRKLSFIDMVNYLIKQNTNILAVNNDGNNFAHIFVVSKHFDKIELQASLAYLISLPEGPDLFKTKNNCGRTPLHEWLESGKELPVPEIIEMLLFCSGEHIDAVDINGKTLLHTAAARQDTFGCMKCFFEFPQSFTETQISEFFEQKNFLSENSRLLSEYLVSIDEIPLEHQHKDFGSPLSNRAFNQKLEVIKYLITNGADITALNNNDDCIAHLLFESKRHGRDTFLQFLQFLSLHKQGSQLQSTNKSDRTPLHEMMLATDVTIDVETIKSVLQTSGEDVNYADIDGNTLFLTAARKKISLACLKCLKEFGSNYHATNKLGRNALHISAKIGCLENVEYFIYLGVSLELQDNNGYTPLLIASYFHELDVLKYFISQNANILAVDNDNCNFAHLLLLGKHFNQNDLIQSIQFLLSLPHASQIMKMTNKWQRTPLHEYICIKNLTSDPVIIKMMLQASGENINAVDVYGRTMFLTAAVNENSVASLKTLIEFGCNYSVTYNNGRNALHLAAEMGCLEYAEYFLSIGVSLELQNKQGSTPLLVASYFHKLDVLKYLISKNANILAMDNNSCNIAHLLLFGKHDNQSDLKHSVQFLLSLPNAFKLLNMRNKLQRTPLHEYINSKSLASDPVIIQTLLQASGENIDAVDIYGSTMFLTAAGSKNSLACLKCLKELGSKDNVTDNYGLNALHISAVIGCLEYVEYFISIGISLESKDNNECTPLLLAAYSHNLDFIKYLIAKQVNIFATSKDGCNIAHLLVISKYDDTTTLKQHFEYINSMQEAKQLFTMTNVCGRTPLHEYIHSNKTPWDSEIFGLLLRNSEEDINASDVLGFPMLLSAAAYQGSLDCLKSLIKLGANQNITDSFGHNSLHAVAINGNVEFAAYLLSTGISLQHQGVDGCTPLHMAVTYQKLKLVKFFIAQHANVVKTDMDGDNIVHQLVKLEHDDKTLLRQMLDYFISLPQGHELYIMKNKWQRTPLHQWIADGVSLPDHEALQIMLQYSKENINTTDIEGDTMLLTAAAKINGLACMQSLIKFGAEINVTNSDERNALHISAEFGILESVKYFALIGVSLEHKDNYSGTPLLVAAYKHNIDVVKYFLKKGANIFALTNDGDNIAHLLLISRQASKKDLVPTIVDLLYLDEALELFQMTNKNGRTPLHEYILRTKLSLDPEILRLVLRYFKEDVNAKDIIGNTMFLSAATRKDSRSCLEVLSRFGASHNLANHEGNTALHLAVQGVIHRRVNLDVVEYLVSKGCSTAHVNQNGLTPLQYAVSLKQLSPLKRDISDLIALL